MLMHMKQKLIHAYNSMTLAIIDYSPHYLMFGCQPCLPIDFYSSTIRGTKKDQGCDHFTAKWYEWLQEASKEAQVQSTSEVERQKQYYDRKANAISLEPSNLVLAKADTYRGKRKVKDWLEEEPYEVECQVVEDVPSYLMKNQQMGCSWVLPWNSLSLITPKKGTPSVCLWGWSGKGVPLPPWRSKLWKRVRQEKCHKVWIVYHHPSMRQMRLL